ncbi:Mn2+dependent serine/threonine protein kinase [Fusobacterium sp.]|uniref:Mn2+dependent serine/threonine protein kinase n=1 Tax=Fusobacterium sp. TaxID=68766 RepID=UPI00396C9F98
MIIINKQKHSEVYFDPDNSVYIKKFNPKFINKIKFFLRFRRYPGENFNYISKELNKIGIKTVKIISYSKYSVTTKKILGIPLDEYLSKSKDYTILNKYIDLVISLLNHGFYSGDLSYDNFFVNNNEIIALDLEDYKKVLFFKKDTNEAIRRLYGKVDLWVIQKIKQGINKNF